MKRRQRNPINLLFSARWYLLFGPMATFERPTPGDMAAAEILHRLENLLTRKNAV